MNFKTATEIIGGTLSRASDSGARFSGVSIDSRTASAGELFFAIRGANNDGHKFVRDAFDNKVAGAVVESGEAAKFAELSPVVSVTDTRRALTALARQYRIDVGAEYCGITGSTGKTTVKEMIHHLLMSSEKLSYVSPGNFNNLFGLPLAILRMDRSVEIGVFELGISTPGEMDDLAPILEPTVAVITNVSATHLEFLQSVATVRAEKLKLLLSVAAGGAAVVPADDPELLSGARDYGVRLVTFSSDPNAVADVKPESVSLDPATGQPVIEYDGRRCILQLFGKHQAANAMCALAACRALGVEVDFDTLKTFSLDHVPGRGEIEHAAGLTLVLDYYNASPASMRSGLETFLALTITPAARKIVVLGDMLELGESSESEHRRIGKTLSQFHSSKNEAETSLAALMTVGVHAKNISDEFMNEIGPDESVLVAHFANSSDLGETLSKFVRPGDAVYFKASRGVKLEEAVTILKGGAFKLN